MEKAICLLEVQAMVAATVGLDAMLKAADVRLIHVEKKLGGRLVTVVVDGTVSAVTAAAQAATNASSQIAIHFMDAGSISEGEIIIDFSISTETLLWGLWAMGGPDPAALPCPTTHILWGLRSRGLFLILKSKI